MQVFPEIFFLIKKNNSNFHKNYLNKEITLVRKDMDVYPVCFKSYSLMFKYYKRLCKIECDTDCKNSLLRSAFIISSPTKLRGDIVTLPSIHPSQSL